MIGIFDAVIFKVKIYRRRRLMTLQQRNDMICTLHGVVSILCIRIGIYAIRNTQALALGHIALKIAIGLPAIRLARIDIANLQNSKINAGVLHLSPVNVSLSAAYIDTPRNSVLGHVVHRARLDAEVGCVIVL